MFIDMPDVKLDFDHTDTEVTVKDVKYLNNVFHLLAKATPEAVGRILERFPRKVYTLILKLPCVIRFVVALLLQNYTCGGRSCKCLYHTPKPRFDNFTTNSGILRIIKIEYPGKI